MREGMYVVLDGTPMQVSKIADTAIPGPRGTSHPAALYYLNPGDGGALTYVTRPSANNVPDWLDLSQYPTLELTPACEQCPRAAGFGRCSIDGNHQGPLTPRVQKPATVDPWAKPASTKDGPCRCQQADCGECGRAARHRWTA